MRNQTKFEVNFPPREPDEVESEDDDEDDEDKRTIFCANLDYRVTEEILYEVFLQAGPIESVRIPKDNDGRQKTFGFITYVHKCSVPFALKLLAGLSLYRKNLTIKTKNGQQQRKQSLPNDIVPLQRRSDGACGRDSFGSHGNNYAGLKEENPFKRSISPPRRIEWGSQRRSDELKKHSSNNSRPHQQSPYSRNDSSRDRGGGGGGYQQNRHNNNDRRAEQRNNNRHR